MEPVAARNQVTLCGSLLALPQLSHENHGKRFFRFLLEVPRLSGVVDTLPVIAEDTVLNTLDLSGGSLLCVRGQVRSHNLRENGRRHLSVFVFASGVAATEGETVNRVQLDGILCREPTYRRTPLGREICDVMLAVPRAFHRADYLPCILWGKVAAQAADCGVGCRMLLDGRLQSRIYTKLTDQGPEERTTYEVSALTAEFPPAQEKST